jgi:hypothetical protein
MHEVNPGKKKNLEIKQQRPILNVEKVELDSVLQLNRKVGSTTTPAYLSPTCDAGTNAVAMGVLLNDLIAREVLCAHSDRKRPRSHQRHVTAEHIEQLWELVQARSTQKSPKLSHPAVVPLRLAGTGCVAQVYSHRTKLQNFEDTIIVTMPRLSKQNGSWTCELDRDGNGN